MEGHTPQQRDTFIKFAEHSDLRILSQRNLAELKHNLATVNCGLAHERCKIGSNTIGRLDLTFTITQDAGAFLSEATVQLDFEQETPEGPHLFHYHSPNRKLRCSSQCLDHERSKPGTQCKKRLRMYYHEEEPWDRSPPELNFTAVAGLTGIADEVKASTRIDASLRSWLSSFRIWRSLSLSWNTKDNTRNTTKLLFDRSGENYDDVEAFKGAIAANSKCHGSTGFAKQELNQHGLAFGTSAQTLLASGGTTTNPWSRSAEWLSRFEALFLETELEAQLQGFKIAVLDTGLSTNAPRINETAARKKILWKDFVGDAKELVDEDGHGTHCTTLLIRLLGSSYFKKSSLCVARVGRNHEEFRNDPLSAERVSEAIKYAADEWQANIITMSLGFESVDKKIKEQIEDLTARRSNPIVFFAAASNDGANSPEMFPAHLENVIAIRGTDTAGAFIKQFNPTSPRDVFGAPSQDIPSDWIPDKRNFGQSGSSIATPIAVAVAVLMMRYATFMVDQGRLEAEDIQMIKSRHGLVEVFRVLQGPPPICDRREYYLGPMHFFSPAIKQEQRFAMITLALSGASRC